MNGQRGISTSYLEKKEAGAKRWEEKSKKIQNGEQPHVWDVLAERGYIKDVAGFVKASFLWRTIWQLR